MCDNPIAVNRIASKYATKQDIASIAVHALFTEILADNSLPYEVRNEIDTLIDEYEGKKDLAIEHDAPTRDIAIWQFYLDTLYDASVDANYLIEIRGGHCRHCGYTRDSEDTQPCARCGKDGLCYC